MDRDALLRILYDVRDGRLEPGDAMALLGTDGAAALVSGDGPAFARIDHDRAHRCGFPEVVYAPGKAPAQVAAIANEILSRSARLLVTRIDDAQWTALSAAVPDAVRHARARAAVVERERRPPVGSVVVLSAGTADEAVAEEARVTVAMLGVGAQAHYDCGVAGLHRLLGVLPSLRTADAVVVVAGMEGALPSVVGGLVDAPVIAVPTSVGYGASFEGLAPLLTMLNSCAAGVAVVNIDNGFGAGYLAATIARRAAHAPEPAGDPAAQKEIQT